MNLISREPWRAIAALQDEINQLFQGRGPRYDTGDQSNIATSHWAPAVDIKEEAERFVITADVPGIAPNAIEITMDDGVLTLRGERKDDQRTEKDGYKRVERVSGTFYRRFALPDGVDSDRVSAVGSHGVLEITIPKVEKTKPRRVEVKA